MNSRFIFTEEDLIFKDVFESYIDSKNLEKNWGGYKYLNIKEDIIMFLYFIREEIFLYRDVDCFDNLILYMKSEGAKKNKMFFCVNDLFVDTEYMDVNMIKINRLNMIIMMFKHIGLNYCNLVEEIKPFIQKHAFEKRLAFIGGIADLNKI